jgi:hypothetical protein
MKLVAAYRSLARVKWEQVRIAGLVGLKFMEGGIVIFEKVRGRV